MDLNVSLSYLCNYILRYSDSKYANLTPGALSRFKCGIHKESFLAISNILQTSDLEIKEVVCKNLIKILLYFYRKCDLDKIDVDSFQMLIELLRPACIGGSTINNEERVFITNLKTELLSKFKDDFSDISDPYLNGIVNDTVVDINVQNRNGQAATQVNNPIASSTQISDSTSNNQTTAILDYLNQFKSDFLSFKAEVSNSIKTIQQSSSSNIPVDNTETKLTSAKIKEIRTNIYRIYDKIIRMEHHKSLFKTHKDNKTVPCMMFYTNYPIPFLWDDSIFIDAYNASIREHQSKTIDIIINRLTAIIESLNQDLLTLKASLTTYNGDIEKFFDNIKATVTVDLKSFIDSGNQKLLRLNENLLEDHIVNEYEINDDLSNDHFNNFIMLPNNNSHQYHTKDYSKNSDAIKTNIKSQNTNQNNNTNRNNNNNNNNQHFNYKNNNNNKSKKNYHGNTNNNASNNHNKTNSSKPKNFNAHQQRNQRSHFQNQENNQTNQRPQSLDNNFNRHSNNSNGTINFQVPRLPTSKE